MTRSRAIVGGQVACVGLAVIGVFLLLPLPWALLVVGVLGALLLTGLEHALGSRTDPPPTYRTRADDRADLETEGA